MQPGRIGIVGSIGSCGPQGKSELAVVVMNVGIPGDLGFTLAVTEHVEHDGVVERFGHGHVTDTQIDVIDADDFDCHFSLGRPAARGGIDHRRLLSPIRSAWRRRNRAHRRCFIDDGLGIVDETAREPAKSFSGFFERVPDERLVRFCGHNAPFLRSLC